MKRFTVLDFAPDFIFSPFAPARSLHRFRSAKTSQNYWHWLPCRENRTLIQKTASHLRALSIRYDTVHPRSDRMDSLGNKFAISKTRSLEKLSTNNISHHIRLSERILDSMPVNYILEAIMKTKRKHKLIPIYQEYVPCFQHTAVHNIFLVSLSKHRQTMSLIFHYDKLDPAYCNMLGFVIRRRKIYSSKSVTFSIEIAVFAPWFGNVLRTQIAPEIMDRIGKSQEPC